MRLPRGAAALPVSVARAESEPSRWSGSPRTPASAARSSPAPPRSPPPGPSAAPRARPRAGRSPPRDRRAPPPPPPAPAPRRTSRWRGARPAPRGPRAGGDREWTELAVHALVEGNVGGEPRQPDVPVSDASSAMIPSSGEAAPAAARTGATGRPALGGGPPAAPPASGRAGPGRRRRRPRAAVGALNRERRAGAPPPSQLPLPAPWSPVRPRTAPPRSSKRASSRGAASCRSPRVRAHDPLPRRGRAG